jgi:hypothetical protein
MFDSGETRIRRQHEVCFSLHSLSLPLYLSRLPLSLFLRMRAQLQGMAEEWVSLMEEGVASLCYRPRYVLSVVAIFLYSSNLLY